MPEDAVKLTPTVLWAQRKDRLLITIDLPNPEHPRVNLEEEGRLTFSATAGKDGEERREYEVVLEFLHPVNAKDSKISVGNRQVFVVVMKTEEVSGREPIPRKPIPPPARAPRVTDPTQRFTPRPAIPAMNWPFPGRVSIAIRARRSAVPVGANPSTRRLLRGKKTRRPVHSFSPPPPTSPRRRTARLTAPTRPPESVHAQFSGEHWPRLLRAKGKVPHVKTDFNKWVDEDEEEESDRDAAFDLAQLRELSTYEHSTYEKDFYGEDEDSDEDDDMPDLERI